MIVNPFHDLFRHGPNFGHMAVYENDLCVEQVGFLLDPIPFSIHRSRRVWKKLQQRQRRNARPDYRPTAYQLDGKMICHPTIARELRRHFLGP